MASLFEHQPESGYIHAHCDGGSRGNPGPSGYGAHITDARGQTIAELSEFLGTRTNNYAEYAGLLAVLAWALKEGHPRVKVVSDSLLMVNQINGRYKVNSPDLKPLWAEARARIAKLEKFEFTHALRHKNKQADALANQAMDRGTNKTVNPTAQPDASTKGVGAPSQSAPSIEVGRPVLPKATTTMLRGFIKNGTVHILGPTTLPDGIFVKILPE